MSLLKMLPDNLISYIYSFDGTYHNVFKSDNFRSAILLQIGAAYKLIDKYIQDLFADDFVWFNNYGTFGNLNETRMLLRYFYTQYNLRIIYDDNTNNIYFKIKPIFEDDEVEDEEEYEVIRYDGFLTRNAIVEDDSYIGVETFHQGGKLHLYVDDI